MNKDLKILFESHFEYERAVRCYHELGDNDEIKKALSDPPHLWRGFLERKLRALYDTQLAEEQRPSPPELKHEVVVSSENLSVKKLIDERRRKFAEVVKQFEDLGEMEKRGAACLRILNLWDEIELLWERTDYFNEFGKHLPDFQEVKVEITGEVELRKRLLNLRTYVSKHQNKRNRKADVAKWKAEIRIIENRLK